MALVTLAAAYAAGKRWVLFEEIPAMVADANARLARYPGCVPD